MEITARSLWTLIHGMGFGALYLLAGSGAIVLLYLRFSTNAQMQASPSCTMTCGFGVCWIAGTLDTLQLSSWPSADESFVNIRASRAPRDMAT